MAEEEKALYLEHLLVRSAASWKSDNSKIFVVADHRHIELFEKVGFRWRTTFSITPLERQPDGDKAQDYRLHFMVWELPRVKLPSDVFVDNNLGLDRKPGQGRASDREIRYTARQHSDTEDTGKETIQYTGPEYQEPNQYDAYDSVPYPPRSRRHGQGVQDRQESEDEAPYDEFMRAESERQHRPTAHRTERGVSRARGERSERPDIQTLPPYQSRLRERRDHSNAPH